MLCCAVTRSAQRDWLMGLFTLQQVGKKKIKKTIFRCVLFTFCVKVLITKTSVRIYQIYYGINFLYNIFYEFIIYANGVMFSVHCVLQYFEVRCVYASKVGITWKLQLRCASHWTFLRTPIYKLRVTDTKQGQELSCFSAAPC